MRKITFETYIKADNPLLVEMNNQGILLNYLLQKEKFNDFFASDIKLNLMRLFIEENISATDNFIFDPLIIENPLKQPYNKMIVCFQGLETFSLLNANNYIIKSFLISIWIKFFEKLPKNYLSTEFNEIKYKLNHLENLEWSINEEIKIIKYKGLKLALNLNINSERLELFTIFQDKKIILFVCKTQDVRYTYQFEKIAIKDNILNIQPKWTFDNTSINLEFLI